MRKEVGTKRVIKRGTGTGTLYFDSETQRAIEAFQLADNNATRHELYLQRIMPAFDKLVESLIFIYGFATPNEPIDHLKNDCVTFLYESLHKFDATRGTKAFSYFNVVARNWLVISSKNRQKKIKRFVSIEDLKESKSAEAEMYHSAQIGSTPEDQMIESGQRDLILEMLKKIKKTLNQQHEQACIDAIITVFEQIDDLDFLNKRAVFVYVKNISNLNQKQMGSAMSVIRKHYRAITKGGGFL
jgi:hypothetical protein